MLIILTSCAAGLALSLLFPAPLPLLTQPHTLTITTQDVVNSPSIVVVENIRYLDGRKVPPEAIKLSPGWRIIQDGWASQGKVASTLEIRGRIPTGLVVTLLYQPEGGKANMVWDGNSFDLRLVTQKKLEHDIVLKASLWNGYPCTQALFVWALLFIYLLGMVTIAGLIILVIRLRRLSPRQDTFLFGILYGMITIGFLAIKLSYFSHDAPAIYRDTFSYADAAGLPLFSTSFWAGTRSFTIPLMYKLFVVNLQNYQLPGKIFIIAHFQSWFSFFCWLVFALILSQLVRNRWAKILTIGLFLFFSLSYEISKWDLIMLSESISFSLLALLLAGWVFLMILPQKPWKPATKAIVIVVIILISILYSFTRDTNLYFVLMSACSFTLAAFISKIKNSIRTYSLVYLAAAILLFVGQNESINIGNRWQIHIYDHLAYRIYNNEAVLDYFIKAGLPYSTRLVNILKLGGTEYFEQMMNDPKMEPVRQWVNEYGKSAYFGYLLSHPRNTLLEPLKRLVFLINGTGQDFRVPLQPLQPIPSKLEILTSILFPYFIPIIGTLIWGLLLAFSFLNIFSLHEQRFWLVVLLLLSIIPLIYIIWHGNPLEIQRHSEQIAIQLRLAIWVSVPLVLDRVLSGIKYPV